jgi:hypothetical protein
LTAVQHVSFAIVLQSVDCEHEFGQAATVVQIGFAYRPQHFGTVVPAQSLSAAQVFLHAAAWTHTF